jgi:hypothetical protein
MKFLTALAVIVLIGMYVSAQERNGKDISLIKPSDRVYADAVNASAIFEQHGLKINSVHRSKLEGFFRDVWNAAVFKSDKGAFEIIFFPESDQAEKITVTEKIEGKRHIYSFAGEPHPRSPAVVMNAAYPLQFIAKGKLFVVINDNDELADILRKILM